MKISSKDFRVRDALPYRSEIGRHRLELRQFGEKRAAGAAGVFGTHRAYISVHTSARSSAPSCSSSMSCSQVKAVIPTVTNAIRLKLCIDCQSSRRASSGSMIGMPSRIG